MVNKTRQLKRLKSQWICIHEAIYAHNFTMIWITENGPIMLLNLIRQCFFESTIDLSLIQDLREVDEEIQDTLMGRDDGNWCIRHSKHVSYIKQRKKCSMNEV